MCRRWIAFGASAALTWSANGGLANAQERQELLVGKHVNYESPQHFALELRFLPYLPNVDSDPSLHGSGPYASAFGSPQRFMFAVEFDWQTLRIPHAGTLGLGGSVGYTNISDPARFAVPHAGGSSLSAETTTLEIVPTYVAVVFRLDVLWREVGIPLVPYAKAGIGYALWRASNTLGTAVYTGADGRDISGEGGTWGTQLAVGLGLNINVFDTYAARTFDEEVGVNGTYVFGELMRADYTGLGFQKHPLWVGDSTWVLGLAFEF